MDIAFNGRVIKLMIIITLMTQHCTQGTGKPSFEKESGVETANAKGFTMGHILANMPQKE